MPPNHPWSMHILYVHRNEESATASTCYNHTHSTIYMVDWRWLQILCRPTPIKGWCLIASLWIWAGLNDLFDQENVSEGTLCNFWGYLIRTCDFCEDEFLLWETSHNSARSPTHCINHSGLSGFCSHSGQQPEMSIQLKTSVLSPH